ncbi:MAG: Spore germination protein [Firmicutes bacterium ADurb.Bin193]|nr:MAG: Spore germination protein [Firmicutes bacterium ADurb.Bin193]
MRNSQDKITIRQSMFVLTTIVFSPSVRFFPNYTARIAKQASWLAPFVAALIMLPMLFISVSIAKKYKDASFITVMDDICTKAVSRVITFLYILWLTLILALYVRYYAERLLTTILPNVDMLVFIIPMLILSAVVARKNAVVLARMSEIILPVITVFFVLCVIGVLPEVKIKNLTPISYLDALPVLYSSLGIIAIWSYMPFIFHFSSIISGKESIKKIGLQTLIAILFISFFSIATAVGVLGDSIIRLIPIPFFAVIKQLSLFDSIERIEAFIVSVWLLSDFVLITFFTIIALDIMKNMFKLTDPKPLAGIYTVIVFFISLYLVRSEFELKELSDTVIVYLNIAFGVIIPALIFIVGKVRKKL